ncbi:MAG TPA: SAP domain-containing protein [Mycobacteriales bacterium]|nr:SAP domain-containing protein [Mycobacteriales bacterium]
MSDQVALSPQMSVADFDNGYFYAADLKRFAREIGIVIGNFRKFELEELIRDYLRTGRVPPVEPARPRGQRDRLSPATVVTNYVDDRATKDFLLSLAGEELTSKSGQWYWLNDWRRERQKAGARFTYRDLADRLRQLMQTDGRLPQIPSARMNNFITDFRTDSANDPGVPRDAVMSAWMWLKQQPGPNTYAEYRRLRPHA